MQLLGRVNQIESNRLNALAKLYDGMKPNQVAPLINKLTDEQAVQVEAGLVFVRAAPQAHQGAIRQDHFQAGCEAETCKVKSKLTFDHRAMKGVTTPMTELWVIEHGKVFYVFPAS